jgi:lysozyme family protein
MAEPDKAYTRTRGFEGGVSTAAGDPGNYCKSGKLIGTAGGLSAAAFERMFGRCPTSIDELVRTQNQSGYNIFKWSYWDAVGGDQIQSQGIAEALADFAYNSGAGGPIWALQTLGFWDAKKNRPDVSRINASRNEAALLDKITDLRRRWCISARDKAGRWLWPDFWQGWETRIAAFSRPGVYPGQPENRTLLRQWRTRWYGNPDGPVNPPHVPAPNKSLGNTFAWIAGGAIVLYGSYRAWKMFS